MLNDPEVLAKAAAFLRDASQTAETQAALLQLTVHVLNHPDTLQEVVKLTQEMAKILAKDPETIQQVIACNSFACTFISVIDGCEFRSQLYLFKR